MRGLALLSRTGDGAVALDSAGRVIGWNSAARRLLGFRPEEVVGQPCHQVLGCQNLQGHALSSANCPLFQAIRFRVPSPAMDVLVRHRGGLRIGVSANVVLLGGKADARALVLLRPSATGVVEAPPLFAAQPGGDRLNAKGQGLARPLNLGGCLDRLLHVTGADAAELFLSAPRGGQLVLAAQRGQAARAFRQIIFFDRGRGYPGLVAQTGEPLLTVDLPHDERYLRSMVKRQGFRFYLCAPVWGASGLLGSLHIASRRHADAVVSHLPLLTGVAWHLGVTLERQRLYVAEAVTCQPFDPKAGASENLRQVADWALRRLIEVSAADCGALLLHDSACDSLQPVSEWEIPPPLQRALARGCNSTLCPAITQQRCILRSGTARAEWPLCSPVQRDVATAFCIPLEIGGQPVGVILLGWLHHDPLPTRRLSFVHAAVQRLAVTMHNAVVAVHEEHRAHMRVPRSIGVGQGAPLAPARALSSPEGPPLAEVTDGTPFLEFRCLGQFTILSNGLPVPPQRFVRRRAHTLLKILLTRYGKRIHREELVELLWPEGNPRSTNALLNVVVHCLRRGLEPIPPVGKSSSFLRTDGEYYAFNTESPHRLDSQEFLEAVGRGGQFETQGQLAEAIEAYHKAISLYVGDYLEEERYSDWCAPEREYLREQFLTALRRAASIYLNQGNPDAAVTCYRRALRAEPILEDVHRALMDALWRAGRRDEALRQYRDCRAILEHELGVAPTPETEALHQGIRAKASFSQ